MKPEHIEEVPDGILKQAYITAAQEVGQYREQFVGTTSNVERCKQLCGPDFAHIPLDWFRKRIPLCAKSPERHGGSWAVAGGKGPAKGYKNNIYSEEYLEHLESEEFAKIREAARKRDGHRCRICNATTSLETHHRSYDTMGTAEEINDVVTLCRKCHVVADKQRRKQAGQPLELSF